MLILQDVYDSTSQGISWALFHDAQTELRKEPLPSRVLLSVVHAN